MNRLTIFVVGCVFVILGSSAHALEVGVFRAEITPPLGSPLCGGGVLPAQKITSPLWARGIVLLPEAETPLVLCAADWVGIGNASHDAWRKALATAAGTTADRVAVHTLHQHDAPFADASTEALMVAAGLPRQTQDPSFVAAARASVAEAVTGAIEAAVPLTHMSYGKAEVEQFASNRRVLGDDGKVHAVRWTACTDPELRAAPAGTIDPLVRVVGFWNEDALITTMTWYATHPQSFYGNGNVNFDTVGMARALFEQETGVTTAIHFNGAGGNIGAGKYNDGSPENRPILAQRLAEGMKQAWASSEKVALTEGDIGWTVVPTALPVRADVQIAHERAVLADAEEKPGVRARAAREIAWLERCAAGHTIDITKLRLGSVDIVHMPGELFVEYQLAAQEMAPERFVCMAAYGDYAPGYICTEVAYDQGGYEPQKGTSRTAPEVEAVLIGALHKLLD